ncbi:MAG: substrate-binding domain-containing protein, partial [Nitrospinota bacterium]
MNQSKGQDSLGISLCINLTGQVNVLIQNSSSFISGCKNWKPLFFVLSFLLLQCVVGERTFAQNNPVVIIHPDNPVKEMSREELVRIFRLRTKTWKDGTRVQLVHLKKGHPARDNFFSNVLVEDAKEVEALYRKKAKGVPRETPVGVLGRKRQGTSYSVLAGKQKRKGVYSQKKYQPKKKFLPKIFSNEKDVIEFVLKNRGSIGYVSKPDTSVRVVSLKAAPVKKRAVTKSGATLPAGVPLVSPKPTTKATAPLSKVTAPKKAPEPLVPVKEGYAVIVHPKNPLKKISKKELVRIFKVRKNRWKDGIRIKPANLRAENPVRRKFFSHVLSEDSNAMEDFYQKRIKVASKASPTSVLGRTGKSAGYSSLTGKTKKRGSLLKRKPASKKLYVPKNFQTEEEVIAFVARTRGAIGYVSRVNKSVKVLGLSDVSLTKKKKTSGKAQPKTKPKVKVVQKALPGPGPKTKPRPMLAPRLKQKPKVLVTKRLALISSSTAGKYKVYDPHPRQTPDILIKGPAYSPEEKGKIRATKEIRVHIPDAVDMEWDDSVIFIQISGDARKHVERKIKYSSDRKTLRVPVIKDFPSNGSVVLSGMKFTHFNSPSQKKDFLWLEVGNSGKREASDDKPVEIVNTPLRLVLSVPFASKVPVGGVVTALGPANEVAGSSFELEIYLVNDENRRVAVSRRAFLKDSWV